ncbi:Mur ligase middle domain-containing protein [Bacillus sp. cl95]|nr:UDP-N-acetylmuramoyl-tripeptide--D-alanyl-D-alanine ligase [Bacillus sp. UNCCL13]SFA77901.1 Mur ligase middle domain-containing protein [Bacillus sp. UNCCL13]SFQ67788.1 Mur ligase middle domain-containing protein [Bacillus sp. cl95]
MKELILSDIVTLIKGTVIHGTDNIIIKGVKNRTKKKMKDNHILFHIKRDKIRGSFWEGYKSLAVITDVPEQIGEWRDNLTVIVVSDIQEAYWTFIDYYRGLFDIPIIGVTGTCGKSTTKEMILQILEKDFNVEATWESMNSMSVNLRYLTDIDESTEIAVYEMPVAYPGYLKVACRYFKPQIRILLNIGVHHLADCETPETYMKAKAEIVDGMDHEADILILNGDDENIKKMVDTSPYKNVVYFGKDDTAHFQAENITYAVNGMKFTLKHEGKCYEVFVPGYGEHNVYNAMAAIAAVSYAGVEMETAIKGLASFSHLEEHLECKQGMNGAVIIDDTWNSAPLSMSTGLKVLSDLSKDKTSIALLGYMPQLGDGQFAVDQYRKMGEEAFSTGVDLLFVVGKEAEQIGISAIECGMDQSKVHFCETGTEIYAIVKDYLSDQAVLYIKITHRVMTRDSFVELKKKLIPDEES